MKKCCVLLTVFLGSATVQAQVDWKKQIQIKVHNFKQKIEACAASPKLRPLSVVQDVSDHIYMDGIIGFLMHTAASEKVLSKETCKRALLYTGACFLLKTVCDYMLSFNKKPRPELSAHASLKEESSATVFANSLVTPSQEVLVVVPQEQETIEVKPELVEVAPQSEDQEMAAFACVIKEDEQQPLPVEPQVSDMPQETKSSEVTT